MLWFSVSRWTTCAFVATTRTYSKYWLTIGKELWKNSEIALTFANDVEDLTEGSKEDYFEQDPANWREAIFSFLSNTLKLDPELMQSLPIVITECYRPVFVLPSGGNWLSEFWIVCDNIARNSILSSWSYSKRTKSDNVRFRRGHGNCLRNVVSDLMQFLGISQFFRSWRNNQQNEQEDL